MQEPFRVITNTDWRWGANHEYIDQLNKNYVFAFKDRVIVPRKDYEWMEVMRGKASCLLYQHLILRKDFDQVKHLVNLFYEGFSKGWPEQERPEPQPFGCWVISLTIHTISLLIQFNSSILLEELVFTLM